jgi:hypothetical protein
LGEEVANPPPPTALLEDVRPDGREEERVLWLRVGGAEEGGSGRGAAGAERVWTRSGWRAPLAMALRARSLSMVLTMTMLPWLSGEGTTP